MTRSLIAGATNYSHQSLDDMVQDLKDWISNLKNIQVVFRNNINKLKETGYWDKSGSDLPFLLIYSEKFFHTSLEELTNIFNEMNDRIDPNHITRIKRLGNTAQDLNNRFGEVWHSGDLQSEIFKSYNSETFMAADELYRKGRDMAVDMIDLDNLAERLADFVGKGVNVPSQNVPIRILFLAANPINTGRLRLDEEVRTINERLRMAQFRDRFQLITEWAVRYSDLTEYLLRHKPHIVHFSGHGSNQGEIIVEDNNGRSKLLAPETLSNLFRILKDNVRCVVLNACFSATQAAAIAREIECVLGMSKAIGDEAAVQFASGFYQALGYGRNVQTAFDLGCSQIDITDLKEEDTPKILVKSGVDAKSIVFASA